MVPYFPRQDDGFLHRYVIYVLNKSRENSIKWTFYLQFLFFFVGVLGYYNPWKGNVFLLLCSPVFQLDGSLALSR